jgi:hypothetical protein
LQQGAAPEVFPAPHVLELSDQNRYYPVLNSTPSHAGKNAQGGRTLMWYWLHNNNDTANKREIIAKKARKIHVVIILACYLKMLKDTNIFTKNCFWRGLPVC